MKTKSTKHALISAALALVMVVAMLVGTTFAWFTDSVTSSGNKIVAGNLDVKLRLYDGNSYQDISDATTPIFGEGGLAQNNAAETLWEPGKTQVVYLAIENAGSLDLKYKVALNVLSISKKMNDVLSYTITPDAMGDAPLTAWDGTNAKAVVEGEQFVSGTEDNVYVSLGAGETHYFALSVHMDEEAGNDYMLGSIIFDLSVLAYQLTSEKDSFGSDYDKDAVKDPVKVESSAALLDMFANSEGGEILDATGVSMDLGTPTNIPADTTIIGLDVVGKSSNVYLVATEGTVTFDSCTFDGTNDTAPIAAEATATKVVFNNCTFEGYSRFNFTTNPGAGVFEFNNCTFMKGNAFIAYVQCLGGIFNFNNCSFDFTGASSMISGVSFKNGHICAFSEGYATKVVLTGCTLINTGRFSAGGASIIVN